LIQAVLRALGKSKGRVTVVFATSAVSADAQVSYLRANLDLPIWLFTTKSPSPAIASQCERVVIASSTIALWLRAQRDLWPHQVALALVEWNGKPGAWPLKFAPFTIPFFRALIRNKDGGFFPGTPRMVSLYARLALQRMWSDANVRRRELGVGAALWIFAFVAQWFSPVSRFAFRRIRGNVHRKLCVPPAGEGIAHHRYKGREWDAHAILELLRHSAARYIFFQREDDRSDAAELIAAFRHPDTFAASRQTAVRAWRKLLFATAPFRALQPGEISRVYAPVSTAMLVDAAKLRALAFPALSSFGSNWYVLFHQAAAAGFSSYSLGSNDTRTQLAAVPFDEAEFVKTLFAEPALGELVPQNGPLARGNIAQSVLPGAGFRALPRVLVVSPYLPFPLSHGGAVRIWNICRSLAHRIDFVLLCFHEQADRVQYAKLQEVFREVYIVDIDEKYHHTAAPRQVNEYESSTMRELIGALCREYSFDVVQLEYTQMAGYLEAAGGTPAVLVEHDLTFTLYQQLGDREYHRWLHFERERLRAFPAVWTMSEFDRARAIAEGSSQQHTYAVPNGVDLQRFHCEPADPTSQRLLYVGSFRHLPNYLAFEELRARIMPEVWARFPSATLDVVAGPLHTDHWPGSREVDPRITVHGFVEDLLPLYTAAAIVLVPLPVSAGTNIKLMEALSCLRPVVTTPVGCAGLELVDGRDVLSRELGHAFSNGVCELLAHPEQRQALAANGLTQAQARFSWESIANAAYKSYEAISPSWPSSPPAPHPPSPPK